MYSFKVIIFPLGVMIWLEQLIARAMKTKNILLLVLILAIQVFVYKVFLLILAMIQDKAMGASELVLIETQGVGGSF